MLDLVKGLVDFILKIDKHLTEIIGNCGGWTLGAETRENGKHSQRNVRTLQPKCRTHSKGIRFEM